MIIFYHCKGTIIFTNLPSLYTSLEMIFILVPPEILDHIRAQAQPKIEIDVTTPYVMAKKS